MHGRATQISASDKAAHTPCHMTELIVVAGRQLQLPPFGQCDQRFDVRGVKRYRLFDINVAAMLQAKPSDAVVCLGWSRNVNDIRLRLAKKLRYILEVSSNPKALIELPCHEWFAVTYGNDLAT